MKRIAFGPLTTAIALDDPGLLKYTAFVGGAWITSSSEKTFPVSNPATGETIAHVTFSGTPETRRAIDAAKSALPDWRALPAKSRSELMRRWHGLLLDAEDDLASLLTAEQGKPHAESLAEVRYGASYIEWFAEEAKRVYGDTVPGPAREKRIVVLKQPIGVVACITAWNFPIALLARKIAPALAAGCTVVCKPANETPLSALALAELADRAGIPPGVVNVVVGHTEEIGRELTSHPDVRKLTFTGSTPVGKMLEEQCASTLKRTSMELGGNAPFIVFDDADIDSAVSNAVASKFRNAGQTCVCVNRFLLQDSIYEEFVEKFTAAMSALEVGPGDEDGISIGPLISEQAAKNVAELVSDATERGAQLVTRNNQPAGPNYVTPAVLTGVTSEMRLFNEEVFGPIAPMIRFATEAEAIALANNTSYGLASYLFTRDMGRGWRVAESLEYGMVGINEGVISNEMAPFGGVKESGHGREGSKYGIDEYLEIKYLAIGGIDSVIAAN